MLQVFCTRPSLQGWRWCDPPPCWSKHWHLSLLRPLHYHIALSSPKCTGLNSDILSLVFYASQVIANTYSKVRSWTTSLLWREGCDGWWKTERCNDFLQPPLRKADILITTEQRHCIYHPSQDRKKTCGRVRSASPGYHHTSLPCLGLMGCMCLLRVTLLADEQRNSLWKVSKCCQDLDSLLSRLPKSPAFPVYILYIRMRTP